MILIDLVKLAIYHYRASVATQISHKDFIHQGFCFFYLVLVLLESVDKETQCVLNFVAGFEKLCLLKHIQVAFMVHHLLVVRVFDWHEVANIDVVHILEINDFCVFGEVSSVQPVAECDWGDSGCSRRADCYTDVVTYYYIRLEQNQDVKRALLFFALKVRF